MAVCMFSTLSAPLVSKLYTGYYIVYMAAACLELYSCTTLQNTTVVRYEN